MKFRRATEADLPEIVRLLADDDLGAKRENFTEPLPDCYYTAFRDIENMPNSQILLVVDDEKILGCLQLMILPGLSIQGMKRAQIEGVRVAKKYRGQKIGTSLLKEAIKIAQLAGCGLVQLTTNKQRQDAYRFYRKLGFQPSHEGMKLSLTIDNV